MLIDTIRLNRSIQNSQNNFNMKPKFINSIVACSTFFLVTFISCSRDVPTAVTNPCTDPACMTSLSSNIRSYDIYASAWNGQGTFSTDFGPELYKAAGGYHNIYNIHILYNGSDDLIADGQKISFLGGNIWLSGTRLSFSAPYGQLPFQTLHLLVNVN